MYTRITTVHNGARFKLTSYGNGAAYCFANTGEGRDVFLQDSEDVRIFEEQREAAETLCGEDATAEDVLAMVWDNGEYSLIAREIAD